jgi:hypothetical protein
VGRAAKTLATREIDAWDDGGAIARVGRALPVNQYFAFGVRPTWMFSGVSLRLLHCASSVHLTNRGDGMSTRQDAGKVVHLECCICMFSPQQIND